MKTTTPTAQRMTTTSLDPVTWPEGEVAHYLDLGQSVFAGSRAASGRRRHAVVVSSTGPIAQLAARKALEAGGSIIDAALTMSFAQVTLALGSWSSFAGIMTLVHFDVASQEVTSINGGYATVRDETDPLSIPLAPTPSGRTALVPGFFAAAQEAHDRFGRLPWADLFLPAIRLARDGFRLPFEVAAMVAMREEVLTRTPEGRNIFLTDGRLPAAGEVFCQPSLADTLTAIAAGGASYVYTGPWADRFVEVVQREGGHLGHHDMAAYAPVISEPLRTTFGEYEVATLAAERGGVAFLEALNLAELAELGDPAKSADALFWQAQICRQVTGTVFQLPDPARAGKAHARQLWTEMQAAGRATFDEPVAAATHSDFMVGADAAGNVVSLMHSINADRWGTSGLFVDGFSIPDSATLQRQLIAEAGPGAHFPNVTSPTLVLRDGRPVAASNMIGSGLPDAAFQCLLAILTRGERPARAASRPMFHGAHFEVPAESPSGAADDASAKVASPSDLDGSQMMRRALPYLRDVPIALESGIDESIVQGVRDKGLGVTVLDPNDPKLSRSFWAGLVIDEDGIEAARGPGCFGLVEGF